MDSREIENTVRKHFIPESYLDIPQGNFMTLKAMKTRENTITYNLPIDYLTSKLTIQYLIARLKPEYSRIKITRFCKEIAVHLKLYT